MNVQELAAGVRPGDVLAGKYRIDRVLGSGGMGVVVAAHHLHLDDRVAIKFLLPNALSNSEAVARFAREAQAAVKIKGEHVARVTDVGTLENGSPYMVMEYLDGGDLAAWLEQHGRLAPEQAVEFVLQACEAIAEAHSLGIVHRDLKPGNLFVVRRPDGSRSVKVLDFGISKRTGLSGSGPSMTQTAAVLGSPLYMSPEQMRSARDVDARSDVWALGVILYELLTGDPPFTAEALPELVLKVVSDEPASIRGKRPEVPQGLERAIMKCLAKDRAARFPSIRELASAIAPYGPSRAAISVQRISGILPGVSDGPHAAAGSSAPRGSALRSDTFASWGQTGEVAAKRRPKALLAAAVVLGLGVAGAVGYAVFLRAPPAETGVARPPVASGAALVSPVSAAASAVPSSARVDPPGAAAPDPPAPSSTGGAAVPVPAGAAAPKPPPVKPRSGQPSRRAPAGDVYDDRK